MVRSVEHYPSETIVVVYAMLRKAPKRVKNATIHDYELEVYEIHKVGDLTENVPFTVYDAENINRDKEEIDEEEIEDSSLISDANTPSGAKSPSDDLSKPSRTSTDLSRFSLDKLTGGGRSEYVSAWCLNSTNFQKVAWTCSDQPDHFPCEFDSTTESWTSELVPHNQSSASNLAFAIYFVLTSIPKASLKFTLPNSKVALLNLVLPFSS
jgi:hypothetical protein